ncbi:MAG: hypothetical protein IID31_06165 [Planctomycetes bacterium]|nr:hypothetical protein [Planctomycetota bacterium]
MKNARISLLVILCAAPAIAQTNGTFLLTSSNTVSPTTPTTTVGIWATWFDPGAEVLFRGADYDLTAGDGVFSNPVNRLFGPFSTGVIAGNVISGAFSGQIHLPPFGSASRDNPILLATYDWTTTDFTPRTVSLDTSNSSYFYIIELAIPDPGRLNMFPGAFTPGSGVINVIPAPTAWVVLALPLAAATRRRRC